VEAGESCSKKSRAQTVPVAIALIYFAFVHDSGKLVLGGIRYTCLA
jgi:hypothetical protein